MGFSIAGVGRYLVPGLGGAGVVAPVADFSADAFSGVESLTVQFTDLSANTPTAWDWDFGDGSAHGNTQNPSHTYSVPGTYTVSLTATNAAGNDTETKVGYITVTYDYLIRDEFTTPASPIANPRTAEPGPGTLNTISGVANIVSSKLQAISNYNGRYTNAITRARGICYVVKMDTAANARVGFDNDTASSLASDAIIIDAVSGITVRSSTGKSVGAFTDNDRVFIILRAAGSFVVKNNKLLMIVADKTDDTVYAGPQWSGAANFDYLRVAQLPAPWNAVNGIATAALTGAQSAGQVISHSANCLLDFTVTTLPSADQIEVQFRKQDATNYWQVTIDSSGVIDLDEVVAGTQVQRGTSGAVTVANGYRVVVVADDVDINVFRLDTAATTDLKGFSYAGAANFKTATAGKLETLGTGGAVSEIISWPRYLTGDALAVLEAM